jgi:pimeloyl-ACP methyl ester carboxylesterase
MTGASAFRHKEALACEALEAAGLREVRPSDRQANIELVPGAREIVLRDTGHFAALEAPDDVARILLDDAR